MLSRSLNTPTRRSPLNCATVWRHLAGRTPAGPEDYAGRRGDAWHVSISSLTALALFGYTIAIFYAASDLAQLRHVWRHRSIAGLSYDTQLAWLASWSAWMVYGISVSDGPIILSSGFGLTFSFLLASRMRSLGARSGLLSRCLLAASYGVLCPAVAFWPSYGGAFLAVVDLAWFGPQLLLASRGSDLAGLSGSAQALNAAINLGWVAYTVAAGHPAAGVWSAATVMASVYLALRVRASRRSLRARTAGSAAHLPAVEQPRNQGRYVRPRRFL